MENKKNEIKLLDESVNEFNKVIAEINIGQYPLLSVGGDSNFSERIKKLEEKNTELNNSRLKLKELNLNIDQQQSLNSTIEEFIKSGLSIVNERQNSNCPLCEHTYESYNQLSQRISNNKALNNILQEFLKEKNLLKQGISALTDEIKKSHELLTDFYRKKIDDLLVKRQELDQTLANLRKEIGSKEENLIKFKQKLSECNIQLNGLSAEEYEKQLRVSIQKAVKSRDNSAKLLSDITIKIAPLDGQIKTQGAQINLIKKEIQKLESHEKYVFVLTWFKDQFPNHLISENILLERKTLFGEKIGTVSAQIAILEAKIAIMKKNLSIYTKEGTVTQQKEWQAKKPEVDGKVDGYSHFLRDKLEINIGESDKETLLIVLNEKEKKYKSELKKIKNLREEYQKLEKYSEHLLPFLQSENAKLEMKKKEKELSFLNDKVKPLIEEEKEKTKKHLNKKISKFFYEDLINDLYRKIDPHPEFKSVEFKADFDTENPRLDVIVKNSNGSKNLIPNLYFSTAQINILSLCIFLASALNSKEYDCIFIDDPIQSLDSINVLSTIDLLRSIVVNENKQIILSTHDKNFHNLLKKKMPENLFNSKFLELESFGKVKREYKKTAQA